MDVFHQSANRVTVYMKPQQQISSPSGTQKEKGTKIDLQQGALWNNFESLKVVNDILCRFSQDWSTGRSYLQQVVPTLL